MGIVKNGDKVSVKYIGKLADGTIFDETENEDYFTFEVGSGDVIPGFENGVIGMKVGDVKTINIPCAEAYGERSDDLVYVVERDNIESGVDLELGDVVEVPLEGDEIAYATVMHFDDEGITLDLNHELAGEDLIFELELMEIN